MKIPTHWIPWKAKAEIERLAAKALERDELKLRLDFERDRHTKARRLLDSSKSELEIAQQKLAAVSKFVIITHGLAGLRVADGLTVDILKRKNEPAKNTSVPIRG